MFYVIAQHGWYNLGLYKNADLACSNAQCNGISDLVWKDDTVFNEYGTVFDHMPLDVTTERSLFIDAKIAYIGDYPYTHPYQLICQASCLPFS